MMPMWTSCTVDIALVSSCVHKQFGDRAPSFSFQGYGVSNCLVPGCVTARKLLTPELTQRGTTIADIGGQTLSKTLDFLEPGHCSVRLRTATAVVEGHHAMCQASLVVRAHFVETGSK